jgi:hypothetical protein
MHMPECAFLGHFFESLRSQPDPTVIWHEKHDGDSPTTWFLTVVEIQYPSPVPCLSPSPPSPRYIWWSSVMVTASRCVLSGSKPNGTMGNPNPLELLLGNSSLESNWPTCTFSLLISCLKSRRTRGRPPP